MSGTSVLVILVLILVGLTVWLYWPERADRDRPSVAEIGRRLTAERDELP
ncbi:CcoQ/FixQ family Cbb3-type cytochrome c oxidase assembly chaperone [Nocardia cyriacigeorgica]|nr:CcoQ/FixQ family Cbb3-type cytochrome c oxidase assembly chaperone [Nocardia cyriacigeorgica]BDT86725.1 hypothetical protein FMUAM8_24890 [Nocardia cyriacigeorgica]